MRNRDEPYDMEKYQAAKRARRPREAKKRTLVKGKNPEGKRGGRPKFLTKRESDERSALIGRLLDRGATRQQVLDALMRPKSSDPSKPGGLGLSAKAAESAFERARKKRVEVFREEEKTAREEQAMRVRGHIASAAQDKQYGAVAHLERSYMQIVGTEGSKRKVRRRGDRREMIANVLEAMTEDEIRDLAGEDPECEGEEEEQED